MGTNGGNGLGGVPGHEMAGAMGSGANQPPATEYTLQGQYCISETRARCSADGMLILEAFA